MSTFKKFKNVIYNIRLYTNNNFDELKVIGMIDDYAKKHNLSDGEELDNNWDIDVDIFREITKVCGVLRKFEK